MLKILMFKPRFNYFDVLAFALVSYIALELMSIWPLLLFIPLSVISVINEKMIDG